MRAPHTVHAYNFRSATDATACRCRALRPSDGALLASLLQAVGRRVVASPGELEGAGPQVRVVLAFWWTRSG